MASVIDSASADLLLDTLSGQLPAEVLHLIQGNPEYKKEALSFLSDFLQSSNDTSDLLLSASLVPSLDESESSHTLIEQVAELDSQQRNLETQLRTKVVNNLDKTLNSTKVLDEITDLFVNDFNEDVDYLLSNFIDENDQSKPDGEEGDEGANEEGDADDSVIRQPDIKLTDEVTNWKNIIINSQKLQANHANGDSARRNTEVDIYGESGDVQDFGITSSSIILRNMDSIMDILELASITNTCVKQGHYAECVEIASHVRRLAIRYSDIPLIAEIEKRIKYEIREMVSGLIRLLNTDLKQSSIIKIVSYLKRIGPFSSFENSNNSDKSNELLKKIFLKSRFQFIISELEVLSPLKRSNSIDRYLKRCLEVIREHCFGSIMTYESIFLSEESNNKKITNTLLYSFIKATVEYLCVILAEFLPQITEQSIKDGLLLQLVYCSQSLSRTGGNFSIMILEDLGSKGVITRNEWFGVLKKQQELVKSLSKGKSMD